MRRFLVFLLMVMVVISFAKVYKIAFIPKLVGIPYFNAMDEGCKRAAKDLGNVEYIYVGPTTDSVAKQIEIIDNLITKGVDAIAVAPNDPAAITPIMKKAKEKGILVITTDTDGAQGVRELFVNQARAEAIGYTMMDVIAELMGGKGKFAIVSGGPTAWNLNTWIMYLQKRLANYPDIELVTIRYAGEDVQKAVEVGLSVIQAFPDIKVIVGMNSTSAPGVAEAVELAGKVGQIWATGITVPSMMKEHMKKGSVKKFILWNPENLGYLTIWAAVQLLEGKEFPAHKPIDVPGIDTKPVYYTENKELVLGPPLIFTPENIDKYNF